MKIVVNPTRIFFAALIYLPLSVLVFGMPVIHALILFTLSIPIMIAIDTLLNRNSPQTTQRVRAMSGGVLPDDVDQRMAIFVGLRERGLSYKVVRYNEVEIERSSDAKLGQFLQENGLTPFEEES